MNQIKNISNKKVDKTITSEENKGKKVSNSRTLKRKNRNYTEPTELQDLKKRKINSSSMLNGNSTESTSKKMPAIIRAYTINKDDRSGKNNNALSSSGANEYSDYQMAFDFLKKEEYKRAEAIFLYYLETSDETAQQGIFCLGLGMSYLGQKKYLEAREAFLKGLEFKGITITQQKDLLIGLKKACENGFQVTESCDDQWLFLNSLGSVYIKLAEIEDGNIHNQFSEKTKAYQEARTTYKKALSILTPEMESEKCDALIGLAEIDLSESHFSKAIESFNAILAIPEVALDVEQKSKIYNGLIHAYKLNLNYVLDLSEKEKIVQTLVQTYVNLLSTYTRYCEYEKVIIVYNQALAEALIIPEILKYKKDMDYCLIHLASIFEGNFSFGFLTPEEKFSNCLKISNIYFNLNFYELIFINDIFAFNFVKDLPETNEIRNQAIEILKQHGSLEIIYYKLASLLHESNKMASNEKITEAMNIILGILQMDSISALFNSEL